MAVANCRDVRKIDKVLQTIPVYEFFQCLSLGPQGQLIALCMLDNKLYYFDNEGKLEETYSLPDDIIHLGMTVVEGGDILLYDRYHSLKLMTPTGEFVREIAKHEAHYHTDILHYHQGLVYLVNRNSSKISIYNMEGELQYSFGSEGSEPGQFYKPHNLCVGPDDYLYVSDSGNSRIQVLERDGTFVRQFVDERVEKPSGIAVTADGYIAVSSTGECSLSFFSVNGKMVHKVENAEFEARSCVVVDKNGFIYVLDHGKRTIVKF